MGSPMAAFILHAGSPGLFHTFLDTALSIGLGVALVGLYLLALRFYVGSDGRGAQ